MAVTSQSTLKELVDETGLIKNDLVNCRNNLKNNLSAKGMDVSGTDKMQVLVDKVNEIEVEKYNFPLKPKTLVTNNRVINMPTFYYSKAIDFSENFRYGIASFSTSSAGFGNYNIAKFDLKENTFVKILAKDLYQSDSSTLGQLVYLKDVVYTAYIGNLAKLYAYDALSFVSTELKGVSNESHKIFKHNGKLLAISYTALYEYDVLGDLWVELKKNDGLISTSDNVFSFQDRLFFYRCHMNHANSDKDRILIREYDFNSNVFLEICNLEHAEVAKNDRKVFIIKADFGGTDDVKLFQNGYLYNWNIKNNILSYIDYLTDFEEAVLNENNNILYNLKSGKFAYVEVLK